MKRKRGNERSKRKAEKLAKKISMLSGLGLVLTWISRPRTSAYLLRRRIDGRRTKEWGGCDGWKRKIRWWEMKMPLAVYNASAETTKWRFRKSKSRRRGCERPHIDLQGGNTLRYLLVAKKPSGTPMCPIFTRNFIWNGNSTESSEIQSINQARSWM